MHDHEKASLDEALAAVCCLASMRAGDMHAAACMDDSVEEHELIDQLNAELDARLQALGWTREELAREVSKTEAARAAAERPSYVDPAGAAVPSEHATW